MAVGDWEKEKRGRNENRETNRNRVRNRVVFFIVQGQ
jgi:hypothetical protein